MSPWGRHEFPRTQESTNQKEEVNTDFFNNGLDLQLQAFAIQKPLLREDEPPPGKDTCNTCIEQQTDLYPEYIKNSSN